jgi:hypothetical protein
MIEETNTRVKDVPVAFCDDTDPAYVPLEVFEQAYQGYLLIVKQTGLPLHAVKDRIIERGGFTAIELDTFCPDWRKQCERINRQRLAKSASDTHQKMLFAMAKLSVEFREYVAAIAYEQGHSAGSEEVDAIACGMATDLLPYISRYNTRKNIPND